MNVAVVALLSLPDLSTDTWIALVAAGIALAATATTIVGIVLNQRNVTRTLAHNERENQFSGYAAARDTALGVLARESLALEDLAIYTWAAPPGVSKVIQRCRQGLADLEAAHVAFAAHAGADDPLVAELGDAVKAFRGAVEAVRTGEMGKLEISVVDQRYSDARDAYGRHYREWTRAVASISASDRLSSVTETDASTS